MSEISLIKSPLSRICPPHFQWSLRPSPPSRASSQSVARPWWVNDDKGPRWPSRGFVCFGGANCWPLGRRIREGQGWGAKGRSTKPPRSTKQRDEENLRDRKIMFIQLFTIRGFHWQVLVDATLAGLQCDEFWWKKSSVTSFKMSCSRNAYNSRNRLEKPSPLDYDNSKVCMLYNIKFQRYHMIQTYPSCSFRFVGLSLSWSAVCIYPIFPNHRDRNQAKPLKQHEDVCDSTGKRRSSINNW